MNEPSWFLRQQRQRVKNLRDDNCSPHTIANKLRLDLDEVMRIIDGLIWDDERPEGAIPDDLYKERFWSTPHL
jgi:hypothetical protein